MQVTRELIKNDIKGSEARLEELKALTAQTAGALNVLKNILAYMDKPEPEVKPEEAKADEAKVEEAVVEELPTKQVVDGVGKYHVVPVEEAASGS